MPPSALPPYFHSAFGAGATTAIYSLVDQVLLHALPVRAPERLVLIDWKGDQVAPGFGIWNLMSYLRLLDRIDQSVEPDLEIHLILDNYGTHKDPAVKSWLAARSRYRVHFTPSSSS
jgi:hypothetical protein